MNETDLYSRLGLSKEAIKSLDEADRAGIKSCDPPKVLMKLTQQRVNYEYRRRNSGLLKGLYLSAIDYIKNKLK